MDSTPEVPVTPETPTKPDAPPPFVEAAPGSLDWLNLHIYAHEQVLAQKNNAVTATTEYAEWLKEQGILDNLRFQRDQLRAWQEKHA